LLKHDILAHNLHNNPFESAQFSKAGLTIRPERLKS